MNSTSRSNRLAFAGAAFVGLAALLTACSSSGPTPAKTVTVTVTPTQAATGTTVIATPTPVVSTTPAGPPPCPTRSLQVKPGLSQGTAGSSYQVIDFKNISNVTCTLYGYPGVSLAGGSPVSQIGAAATENKSPARTLVALAPGAVANALLRIVDAGNFPASKCHLVTATYLQVYPPNQTTPVYVGYSSPACSSKQVQLLSVTVVQPGSGG